MKKRVISAILGIILIGYINNFGGLPYLMSIAFLNIIALWELKNAFKNVKVNIFFPLAALFTGIYYMLSYKFNFSTVFILNFIIVIFISFFYSIIKNDIKKLNDTVYTIFSFIYTISLFSHFIFVRNLQNGALLVWWIFIMTWACDTGAFFSGMFFGRQKLSPKISPNKTIAGGVGGIMSTIISSVIFARFFFPHISLKICAILGLVIGITSQIGDLSASYIKRHCQIKDFSNTIPGHGGILDRFDSSLFSFPMAYYFFVLVIKKGVLP